MLDQGRGRWTVSQKSVMIHYLLSVIVIVVIFLQEQFSCCLTRVRPGEAGATFEALLSLKFNNFKTVQAMTAKPSDFS